MDKQNRTKQNKTNQNKWFLRYFHSHSHSHSHSFASGRKGDTARYQIRKKWRSGWFQRIYRCFLWFFRTYAGIHLVSSLDMLVSIVWISRYFDNCEVSDFREVHIYMQKPNYMHDCRFISGISTPSFRKVRWWQISIFFKLLALFHFTPDKPFYRAFLWGLWE
jgi:hypothetical protein